MANSFPTLPPVSDEIKNKDPKVRIQEIIDAKLAEQQAIIDAAKQNK